MFLYFSVLKWKCSKTIWLKTCHLLDKTNQNDTALLISVYNMNLSHIFLILSTFSSVITCCSCFWLFEIENVSFNDYTFQTVYYFLFVLLFFAWLFLTLKTRFCCWVFFPLKILFLFVGIWLCLLNSAYRYRVCSVGDCALDMVKQTWSAHQGQRTDAHET